MHAGLHTPACILNQTFSPLGIPPRFMPVEIRSKESVRARRSGTGGVSSNFTRSGVALSRRGLCSRSGNLANRPFLRCLAERGHRVSF